MAYKGAKKETSMTLMSSKSSTQAIYTPKAPTPVGPYSQAISVGHLLLGSGQIPLDAPSGEIVSGGAVEQTKKVMENIRAVLEAAHMDFSHVVKCGIFLTNLDDFAAVNEVYSTYFKDTPPARSCVEVSRLPKGVDVEIEFIASR